MYSSKREEEQEQQELIQMVYLLDMFLWNSISIAYIIQSILLKSRQTKQILKHSDAFFSKQ